LTREARESISIPYSFPIRDRLPEIGASQAILPKAIRPRAISLKTPICGKTRRLIRDKIAMVKHLNACATISTPSIETAGVDRDFSRTLLSEMQ
jgi:hypothetical protein